MVQRYNRKLSLDITVPSPRCKGFLGHFSTFNLQFPWFRWKKSVFQVMTTDPKCFKKYDSNPETYLKLVEKKVKES